MRTTKVQIEKLFELLCKACGKRVATSYDDVGAWRLDYNTAYGGWNIEEIYNEGGAVTHPFGPARMTGEAFWRMMRFGVDAVGVAKGGKGGGGAKVTRRR